MDLMTGQILLTAFDYAPAGTLACNGQVVSASTYAGLFGVLAASYGGNGTSSFGVPNIPPVSTQSGTNLNWVIVTDGAPWGSGMEGAVGEVRLLPAVPPANSTLAQTWKACDGSAIKITDNEPLFALLGTLFGGDGAQTFDLPKLATVAATNGPPLTYWLCYDGTFPPVNSGNSVTPTPGTYVWETYLGTVLQLAYVPAFTQQLDGLGLCLGQTMPITTWLALFSLLGPRFGGNGTSFFMLPSRPTGTDNIVYATVVNGYYPSRS